MSMHRLSFNLNLMSLQCDNLSGELQDQWSSSLVVKMKFFTGKILIFFLFLLKTCFGAKISIYPCIDQLANLHSDTLRDLAPLPCL